MQFNPEKRGDAIKMLKHPWLRSEYNMKRTKFRQINKQLSLTEIMYTIRAGNHVENFKIREVASIIDAVDIKFKRYIE